MIYSKSKPANMRKMEAVKAARMILDRVRHANVPSQNRTLSIDPRSRDSRITGLRKIAAEAGPCSLGSAHDASCRIGYWSYLSTMNGTSLYKGIAVVANVIDFEAMPVDRESGFAVETGLEVLVDMHILKRLALRLGARSVDAQMEALRPVIAWCAAANQTDITGRFVVPTQDGLFFCRREILPTSDGKGPDEIGARIVTFYGFDEMRGAHLNSWARMRDRGVMKETPAYPRLKSAGHNELIHLCSMAGEDLMIRSSLETHVSRPGR
ncbi:hypothetical protein KUV57_13770 [Epibacterium sp. DP7N7-1]|nr:hypothetical protein [Epibacterium sp. DP7N7-1]